MQTITFITGNEKKADYLAKYLGFPIEHIKLDLDELQSLDLREIVEHKVKQAYSKVGKPVIVEDVSFEFCALGRLPGTFIKFFVEELSLDTIIALLDGKDKTAIAKAMVAYYDGEHLEIFEGSVQGKIAENPSGTNGFGWDQIFIIEGQTVTNGDLNDEEYEKFYTALKPFAKVREFLLSL